MVVASEIYRIEDPLDHVSAVAGQQRSDVDVTFLQVFVWVELIERALQLPVRGFVARHLRADKARAQAVELILNLFPAGIERARERRVDRLQLVAQTIELAIHILFGVAEKFRRARAEMLFDDASDHRFETFEEIRERESVAFEHS